MKSNSARHCSTSPCAANRQFSRIRRHRTRGKNVKVRIVWHLHEAGDGFLVRQQGAQTTVSSRPRRLRSTGRLISASTSRTFLSDWAREAARLNATVDLPSPGLALETSRTCGGTPLREIRSPERSPRTDSPKAGYCSVSQRGLDGELGLDRFHLRNDPQHRNLQSLDLFDALYLVVDRIDQQSHATTTRFESLRLSPDTGNLGRLGLDGVPARSTTVTLEEWRPSRIPASLAA